MPHNASAKGYTVAEHAMLHRSGKRIALLRQNARLTRDKFGALIGISASGVWNIEKGTSGMSAVLAVRISRALKVPLHYICAFDNEEHEKSSEIYLRMAAELTTIILRERNNANNTHTNTRDDTRAK